MPEATRPVSITIVPTPSITMPVVSLHHTKKRLLAFDELIANKRRYASLDAASTNSNQNQSKHCSPPMWWITLQPTNQPS
jgi:hypothetical protein